jgi:hypothetical protein
MSYLANLKGELARKMNPRAIRFEFADPAGAINDSKLPEWKHFDRVIENTDPNCEWTKNRNFNKRVRVHREADHYYTNNQENKENENYENKIMTTPVNNNISYATMVSPGIVNPYDKNLQNNTSTNLSKNTNATDNTEISTMSNTNNEVETLKEKFDNLNLVVQGMEQKIHTITKQAVDAMGNRCNLITQEAMADVRIQIENSKNEVRIELKNEINAKSDDNTNLILIRLEAMTLTLNNSNAVNNKKIENIQDNMEKKLERNNKDLTKLISKRERGTILLSKPRLLKGKQKSQARLD